MSTLPRYFRRQPVPPIARASSTSISRYLTALSILVWPSRSSTARRLPVRPVDQGGLRPPQTSRPGVLDGPQSRDIFVLDGGLLDSTLVRVGTVASAEMYDYALPLGRPKRSDRPHVHAQVPSHRSPSIERLRIHVKGMVRSTGWLDGFPEVGRRGGPWRWRWATGLLDVSTEGQNDSLRHGAACRSLCKNRNRAATQPSL
jgi:hypothetical protein